MVLKIVMVLALRMTYLTGFEVLDLRGWPSPWGSCGVD